MISSANGKMEPIAIVGLGAIYPGATNPAEFWRIITKGDDLVTDVPPGHWLISDYYDSNPNAIDKTYCKKGAFLPDITFDPLEYGIPPSNIPVIDTSQLLGLVVAKQVLQDATGIRYLEMDLSRVSVILGAAALEALQYAAGRMQRPVWVKALREAGLPESQVQTVCDSISSSYVGWQENNFPGLLSNVIAGRIANRFNLGGTNCVIDAACAGSLAAVHLAISELQTHKADMVITGGVDTLNDIIMYMCFSKTKALSLSNDCQPFSAKADGTVLGEGVGMFALKRLSDAEKNGDKIYAQIKGIGTSSDGRSKSIYAPLPTGQSKAILRAYEQADFQPHTIGLIEAHGTATKAGDVAEFAGLCLAFKEDKQAKSKSCALGSIKGQIGHTKSAAGAAGLFKAVMSLHHKTLPPTIKVDQPNPEMDWENSAFYLNTQLRPWIKNSAFPRRAGVSSFGFGGSNFHLALEEYTGPYRAERIRTNPTELILLSADQPTALIKCCQAMIDSINQFSFVAIAKQSQTSVAKNHLARLAIVASDKKDLSEKLLIAINKLKAEPTVSANIAKGIYYGMACDPGRVAFLFPGQGSQYINMGADLALSFESAIALWDEAASQSKEDTCLQDVVFPPSTFTPEAKEQQALELTKTQWAQPALAVTDTLYLSLLEKTNIQADIMAGHSFGELVALHAAGAMDRATLMAIAKQRGVVMQQASSKSASGMLSVSHPVSPLLELLEQEKISLTPANFNSPQQLILSGSLSEIDKIKILFDKKKIAYKQLPVSAAFHSPLMQSASTAFASYLSSIPFKPLQAPVIANETAQPYRQSGEQIANMLAEQLIKPVRFSDTIENMYQQGVRTFIEVGPRNILTGLVNATLANKPITTIPLDNKNESGITSLWQAFGRMFVLGLNPELSTLWQGDQIDLAPEIVKPHVLKINGTNYAKPYPPAEGQKALPAPNTEEQKALPVSNLEVCKPATSSPLINNRGISMPHSNQSLLQTYQELHRQLIDAHNTYQKMMAETHISFLQAMNQISQHMAAPGAQIDKTPLTMPVLSAPVAHAKPLIAPSPVLSAPSLAAPTPIVQQARAEITSPAIMPTPTAALSKPVEKIEPINKPIANTATLDLKEIILGIVVEKTGYPRDMLNLDMSIESDLGIDSIKRVEILSGLTEKVPNLPEISPNELGLIQTLGDILTYAEKHYRSAGNSQERTG